MGKMNYSAFRRGVALGFSSPYRLAFGDRWHPSYRASDTLALAWREVGKLLGEELRSEGERQIGCRADQENDATKRKTS